MKRKEMFTNENIQAPSNRQVSLNPRWWLQSYHQGYRFAAIPLFVIVPVWVKGMPHIMVLLAIYQHLNISKGFLKNDKKKQ